MDNLRVRVYNVRFGDAILISVPDKGTNGLSQMRHILIDFGNVAAMVGPGGSDDVFAPVVNDIITITQGRPLDLYVMTHEHLDHVQGPLYACEKLGKQLKANYAWLTASAAPDYYASHPRAKKQLDLFHKAFDQIQQYFTVATELAADAAMNALFGTLLLNNNPARTTDCVKFLQNMTGDPKRNTYVHRDSDLKGRHPFQEAQFEIWAPEEDTADYYRDLHPMALGVSTTGSGDNAKATLASLKPPSGIDAGAFYNLVETRRNGFADNMLAIDRAANNTSVVFVLKWRGWKLLFTGDAEQASWRMMDKFGKLQPVDFLKMAHHGSWNGTPPVELLDKVMPAAGQQPHPRFAAVSTWNDTYSGVPDSTALSEVAARCQLKSTLRDLSPDHPDQFYLDFEFNG